MELKNTGNIKEIKEIKKDISKKLKKKPPLGEDSSLKYLINFKRINLIRLINRKYFMVPCTIS